MRNSPLSNKRLNMKASGSATVLAHRRKTMAGMPSGPGAYELFSFLLASMIIAGDISNVSRSTASCTALDVAIQRLRRKMFLMEDGCEMPRNAYFGCASLFNAFKNYVGRYKRIFLLLFTKLSKAFGF